MTVIPWPRGKSRRPVKLVVDPLPQAVLHSLVRDIPGPKNETEAHRTARFEVQLIEVLDYKPRNAAEAMLAVNCIMLRPFAKGTNRDAARPGRPPMTAARVLRTDKQFTQLLGKLEKMLTRRQTGPQPEMDPAIYKSLGLSGFLVPDPADTEHDEEAVSAIIVPLHPAPKMLQ
jgi:hypothetical protein